jgi:DNA-binding FadR family transcriptional regulator
MSVLGPLPPRQSIVTAAAAAVRRAILAGELAPGSRLPPERTLSETLGVHRSTLRAALKELETSGLVRVRQGSAYTVQDWRASGGPELVATALGLEGDLTKRHAIARDLLELRGQLLALALDRLVRAGFTQGALESFERLARDYEASVESRASAASLEEHEQRLRQALLASSESDVLRLHANPVDASIVAFVELCEALHTEPTEGVTAFGALVDALATQGSLEAPLERLRVRDAAALERLATPRGAKARPKASASDRTLALPFARG